MQELKKERKQIRISLHENFWFKKLTFKMYISH